jgi:hypothetical protein
LYSDILRERARRSAKARFAKLQHTGVTVQIERTSRHYFMCFCNFHRFSGNFAGQINSILSKLYCMVQQMRSFSGLASTGNGSCGYSRTQALRSPATVSLVTIHA